MRKQQVCSTLISPGHIQCPCPILLACGFSTKHCESFCETWPREIYYQKPWGDTQVTGIPWDALGNAQAMAPQPYHEGPAERRPRRGHFIVFKILFLLKIQAYKNFYLNNYCHLELKPQNAPRTSKMFHMQIIKRKPSWYPLSKDE